jgi:hypothetical protein
MKTPFTVYRVVVALAFIAIGFSGAADGAQRTFVSVTGSDANPCTVAAPCRSFNGALAQTNAGGEVVAVDSGGYGPATIDKSVLIAAAPGVHAAITVSSGSGLVVDGSGIVVTLRNLTITGLGGSHGVNIQSAAQVYLENCSITDLGLNGVFYGNVSNWGNGNLISIRDSTVARNHAGIYIAAQGSFVLALIVDNSLLASNGHGLVVLGGGFVRGTIFRTLFVKNTQWGLYQLKSSGTSGLISIEDSVFASNVGGIESNGTGGPSYVRVSNTVVTGQTGTALSAVSGGHLLSRQNNTVEDNVTQGAFSGTYTAK